MLNKKINRFFDPHELHGWRNIHYLAQLIFKSARCACSTTLAIILAGIVGLAWNSSSVRYPDTSRWLLLKPFNECEIQLIQTNCSFCLLILILFIWKNLECPAYLTNKQWLIFKMQVRTVVLTVLGLIHTRRIRCHWVRQLSGRSLRLTPLSRRMTGPSLLTERGGACRVPLLAMERSDENWHAFCFRLIRQGRMRK